MSARETATAAVVNVPARRQVPPHQTRVLPVLEFHMRAVAPREPSVVWLPVCDATSPGVLCLQARHLLEGGCGFVSSPWGHRPTRLWFPPGLFLGWLGRARFFFGLSAHSLAAFHHPRMCLKISL